MIVNVPRHIVSLGPTAEYIYTEAIRKGNKPGFAEMLAMRKAPSAETESTFLSNFGKLLDQFDGDEHYTDAVVAAARKQGYNPSPNDVYQPALASQMGDPQAFIKSRGEAIAVAEERGAELEINGRTVVKHRQPEVDPYETAPQLSNDLAAPEVAKLMKSNNKLSAGEAREAVNEKHGSKK
jgi:hypothetical protein